MKTGLVLSGGGARAFMHLGVIQALEEAEIPVHHICGTSAGAMAGVLYAQGYTPKECLGILTKSDLFRSVRFAFGGNGLLRISKIEAFLAKYLSAKNFSELKTPLIITATDIVSGETVVFESGDVIKPMVASCGLPGLFEPYRLDGRELVDGGVLNNMPVEYLEGKADFIIGAHCNPFTLNRPLKNSFEVAYRSLLLAVHHQNITRLKKCSLLIEPPEMCNYSIFDFRKAAAIYQAGYTFTQTTLKNRPASFISDSTLEK